MTTHSSILAQKIPWTEEPGGLQFMRSQGVGHDRVTKHTYLSIAVLIYVLARLNNLAQYWEKSIEFLS